MEDPTQPVSPIGGVVDPTAPVQPGVQTPAEPTTGPMGPTTGPTMPTPTTGEEPAVPVGGTVPGMSTAPVFDPTAPVAPTTEPDAPVTGQPEDDQGQPGGTPTA